MFLTPLSGQTHFDYAVALRPANAPTTPSLAAGLAQITVDAFPNFTTIGWNIRWSNLSGLPVSAHIHAPGNEGGTPATLFSLGSFFTDSTAASGAYAGFKQVSDPAQTALLQAGLGFVDIHTAAFLEGELTGRLHSIPEPSVTGLLAVACLLGLLRHPRTT